MSIRLEIEQQGRELLRVVPLDNAERISQRSAFERLRDDSGFRRVLIDQLREAPFEAYFWECPAISAKTSEQPFEWIVKETHRLVGVRPSEHTFSDYLDRSDEVAAFWNLGRDARLIAPCQGANAHCYSHLATFVREAPPGQVDRLFEVVGEETLAHIEQSTAPVWISTSGLGVYWLHVRLDSTPKYYTFADYKRPSGVTPRSTLPPK